jgi:hypothetical protein
MFAASNSSTTSFVARFQQGVHVVGWSVSSAARLEQLYLCGPEARVLEIVSSLPTDNDVPVFANLWGPLGRAARRAPGFAEFARKIGYADLWDRYGPADGCRRVAPRDYACD